MPPAMIAQWVVCVGLASIGPAVGPRLLGVGVVDVVVHRIPQLEHAVGQRVPADLGEPRSEDVEEYPLLVEGQVYRVRGGSCLELPEDGLRVAPVRDTVEQLAACVPADVDKTRVDP